MATPTVDLNSELVDLSTVPLDELRHLRTPALELAIQHVYENAANTAGGEVQDQRG
jgi:hypothetical protein